MCIRDSDDTVRDGQSILKVLDEATKSNEKHVKERDILFGVNGSFACVYDGKYVYMRASQNPDNEPLVNYTLAFTKMRGFYSPEDMKSLELVKGNRFTQGMTVGKLSLRNHMDSYALGNYLFDIVKNPNQEHPLHDEAIEKIMIEKLTKLLKKIEAPKEEFIRLGLK